MCIRDRPVDLACVSNLLRAAPPQAHERFPVRLGERRELVADAAAAGEPKFRRLFIVRSDDITAVEGPDLANLRLRPEDVVVLDADARVFRSQVVNVDGDEQMGDVSERTTLRATAMRSVRLHLGAPALGDDLDSEALLSELRRLAGAEETTGDRSPSAVDLRSNLREFLAKWARPSETGGAPSGSPADESKSLLSALPSLDGRAAADIVVANEADADFWLVVAGTLLREVDEEARQTWTPRDSSERSGTGRKITPGAYSPRAGCAACNESDAHGRSRACPAGGGTSNSRPLLHGGASVSTRSLHEISSYASWGPDTVTDERHSHMWRRNSSRRTQVPEGCRRSSLSTSGTS